jgi:hypothetical protein
MKNIGKPCTGKPYARFDEGGLVRVSMGWLLRHRRTKVAETDRSIPNDAGACPLLYPCLPPEQAIATEPDSYGQIAGGSKHKM